MGAGLDLGRALKSSHCTCLGVAFMIADGVGDRGGCPFAVPADLACCTVLHAEMLTATYRTIVWLSLNWKASLYMLYMRAQHQIQKCSS